MEAHEGWRKSSRSQGDANNCVEVRLGPAGPQLSDSKLAHARPIISINEASYIGFLAHVKSDSLHPME
ncbi:DUF397 domain-containing protein [Glycomyces sp. NPDC047010]|uniref:DUF397 domain-containing protein n=1 Tax=Glycomyces sp. NPDC047010 TaxID=3155023 RepID=UPI003405A5DC